MMAAASSNANMPEFMAGKCMGMCPHSEIRLRQREELIHPLEMAIGSNGERQRYNDPKMMVKEFSRSAAGQEMRECDIRPWPILNRTVKFLITNSCCRTDVSWPLIYQFVSDRLRAVRQDLCVQGLKNLDCIKLHLASIRFHVYAHYRTCEHSLTDFDPYLNKKTLMETLAIVISLYKDLDVGKSDIEISDNPLMPGAEYEENWPEEDEGEVDEESQETEADSNENKITKDSQTNEKSGEKLENTLRRIEGLNLQEQSGANTLPPGEPSGGNSIMTTTSAHSQNVIESVKAYNDREEAEALYILVNFGSEPALKHTLELPKLVRESPLVSLALGMNMAWLTHNYHRVLRLALYLPPLCLLAFHPHLPTVQRQALTILSRSHSCKGQVFNTVELSETLFFSDQGSMREACEYYGITTTDMGISFNKGTCKTDIPVMKNARHGWIEEKLVKVPLTDLLLPQDAREDCTNQGELAVPKYVHPASVSSSLIQILSSIEEVSVDTAINGEQLENIRHETTESNATTREVFNIHDVMPCDDKNVLNDNNSSVEQLVGMTKVEKLKVQDDNGSDSGIEDVPVKEPFLACKEKFLSFKDLQGHSSKRPLVKPSNKVIKDLDIVDDCIMNWVSPKVITEHGNNHEHISTTCQAILADITSFENYRPELVPCQESILDLVPLRTLGTGEDASSQFVPSGSSASAEELPGAVSSPPYPGSDEKAAVRRRKKEEMSQRVKDMVEKQRSNEMWLEKRRMVCNATCLHVVLILLVIGILGFLFQLYYMT